MRIIKPLFLPLLIAGCLSAQTFNGTGGPIADNPQTTTFTVNVSGLVPGTLDTMNFGLEQVCIDLTHTWVSDLEIYLIAPDNTMFMLTGGNGGSGDDYNNTCFRQDATQSILSGNPPFTGTFIPQEAMGVVNNGQNGNGQWRLFFVDTYPADAGFLNSWSLTFGNNPASMPPPLGSSNLPIVVINTNNQSIPDEPKIMVDMGVIWNGTGVRNYMTDPFNHYNGKIMIEVRGSSSQMFPKKSYGFETVNSLGVEIDSGFFGMPKESDWVLSANYSDKSLQNNVLAYEISRNMGYYAPRTQYVELVINGDYKGIYVFMEKIKRDNKRVDIARLNNWENAGDSLTGGYIIKIDKFTGNGSQFWTSPYPPAVNPNGQTIRFQYEYPSEDSITPQQKTYIQQYVDSFEDALAAPNFADPVFGYRRYANMYSFVDYFLVNEVSKNVDGYRISTFFFKDKYSKGGKITMGPVWDYDIAWGNANYCGGNSITGWAYQFGNVCPGDGFQVPRWWQRMLQDTTFRNAVKCQWSYWRTRMLDTVKLFSYVDSITMLLAESSGRNFSRWPILGQYVWPNPSPIPTSFGGERDELKSWLRQRILWMDANLPGTCYSLGEFEQDKAEAGFVLYPNPADEFIYLSFDSPAGKDIWIELYDLKGNRILAIPQKADAGFNQYFVPLAERALASGIYLLRLSGENLQITRRFSLR